MRFTMKAMKVLLQTMKFNFAFGNSYSENGKDLWSFYSIFPLTCSRFSFRITHYGFMHDAFGYHSSRVREKRKIVDSISWAVWWELKTHWECCVCVSRIIVIRPYSGLSMLAHQRKILTLCSWGRTISIDCLQILLMAQDSDSVQRQIGIRTVHIELCSSISVYRMYRFVAHSTLNILNIEHQLCYLVNWK